jgi:hypothetical protein
MVPYTQITWYMPIFRKAITCIATYDILSSANGLHNELSSMTALYRYLWCPKLG